MDNPTGVEVTQQSVDIHYAPDYQKIVDSRWHFLDIPLELDFSVSHADAGATHYWVEKICDHNLGYLPAFTFRQKTLNLGGSNPLLYSGVLVADKRSIYWRNVYISGNPTTPIVLTGFIRVFACDITATYQAPINLIAPSAATPPTTGLKILGSGTDITSTDLSDFSIDTQGKAIAIQQTGISTVDPTTGRGTIQHNLGYPPTYFLAQIQGANDLGISTNPLQEDVVLNMGVPIAVITATSTTLVFRGVQSALLGRYAFLLTKEPTELAI